MKRTIIAFPIRLDVYKRRDQITTIKDTKKKWPTKEKDRSWKFVKPIDLKNSLITISVRWTFSFTIRNGYEFHGGGKQITRHQRHNIIYKNKIFPLVVKVKRNHECLTHWSGLKSLEMLPRVGTHKTFCRVTKSTCKE